MDEQDRDKILNRAVRRIADDFGCTIDEVNALLDCHPFEVNRDKYLRRVLALQLLQLDEIEEAFHDKAIKDCDVAAGVLLIKAQERRATLLGTNAPIGHAVRVVSHPPEHRETSTDKIEKALARLIEDQRREQTNGSGEAH